MFKRTAAAFWIGIMLGPPAFAEPSANDPNSCADLWSGIGLPAAADDGPATDIVCHTGYVLAHNARTKTPDWVVEHVTRDIAEGTNARPSVKFRAETALPEGTPRAEDSDYENSDFDRGHQAPSADFKSSKDLMIDTFFLSNAVPQEGEGFNRDIWQRLEGQVQKLAIARGELYVITGPVYQEKRAIEVKAEADACRNAVELKPLGETAITDGVAIPAALFKIIYDPRLGRANAYLLPNVDHRPLRANRHTIDYLKLYRVGVGTVEAVTGYQFFDALPDRSRRIIEDECAATMIH